MYRYNEKWSTQVLTTSLKTSSPDVITKRENTEYRVQSNFFKLLLLESALNSVLELLLTYENCDWLFSGVNILNNIFFTTVIIFFFAVYLSDIRVFILNWSKWRIFMEGQVSLRKQGKFRGRVQCRSRRILRSPMPDEHPVM